MSLDSSDDYLTLKDDLLDMWVPAIGARTAEEFWKKHLEKMIDCLLDIEPELKDVMSLFQELKKKTAATLTHDVFRRNLDSYFDDQAPFQLDEAILTGSLSEGLFLYSTEPPDMDFMCVLKNISFSLTDQEDGSLMLRDDTPFVHAFVKTEEEKELWYEFFFDDENTQAGKHRLSSKKFKEKLREKYQKTGKIFCRREEVEKLGEGAAMAVHKPEPTVCVFEAFLNTIDKMIRATCTPLDRTCRPKLLEFNNQLMYRVFYTLAPCTDIVLSIFCHEWPSCAREWITRERVWPQIHAVEKIARSGFHIVPKSSDDGDFRLSFSCAETMLIELLSPLQHRVIRAFKAVIKYHQSIWSSTFEGIIASYHLKTIAFWHFEKSPQQYCTEETIVHHLLTLLGDLAEALRVQHLRMYFMPKFNLFHDFDDPDVMLGLADTITQISQNFPTMCKAVKNSSTLKFSNVFPLQNLNTAVNNISSRLAELEEANDGSESLLTLWFNFFTAMENCVE